MKFLFITTANLSTNPRLAKEMFLASGEFDVTCLCFRLGNWSDALHDEIKLRLPGVRFIEIPAHRRPWLPWMQSSLIEKGFQLIQRCGFLRNNLLASALAHSKRTWLILRRLKEIEETPDLIIGHNLGSLYPACYLSKKSGIPFAFDVEDYHPGEKVTDRPAAGEVKRRELIMAKLLPQAAYISFASPLTGAAVKKLLSNAGHAMPHQQFCVLNANPSSEFTTPRLNETSKLHVVWFSQNITSGRGLELFLPAMASFRENLSVTLIGNITSEVEETLLSGRRDFVTVHPPLPQPDLHRKLSEFDIGLACDLASEDYNREIALTNKIIAYFQAGLFILATDTQAQSRFLSEYPGTGVCVNPEMTEIEKQVGELVENIEQIRARRYERFESAKDIAWERESQKLLQAWKAALSITDKEVTI